MKLYYFVILISGIIIVLNLAGFDLPSGSLVSSFVDGGLENAKSNQIYKKILTILGLAAAVGIVAGLFGRTPDVNILKAGLVSLFGGLFLTDLIWIYGQLISYGVPWITAIASALFIPLTIGFMITLIEWWGGND